MAVDPMPAPAWQAMTGEQARRWGEVLDTLAGALPSDAAAVVIDGGDEHATVVVDRLAATLHALGRPCVRLTAAIPPAGEDAWRASRTANTVTLACGPRWRAHPPAGGWDVVIWLRASPVASIPDGDQEHAADIVIDLRDPTWPVIRHITAGLAPPGRWYVTESRAFFAVRAATWDTRFGDELPAYTAAVAEADLPAGSVVVDVGCGTGRALPALRDAVGRDGVVIGLDLTPQMLDIARTRARAQRAGLVLADARHLPLADASVDAVFAAGLITHLPNLTDGLRELARVTRPGGRLVLFHPAGRASLAARHGRTLRPDEPLAEAPLRRSTGHTGWRLTRYDDPPHRFLAIATRR